MLETARLCSERLLARSESGIVSPALNDVRRELGLAGFFASADLPGNVRRAALARAYHPSDWNVVGHQEDDSGLVAAVQHARCAVEAGLIAPGLSDHMHLAHIHVLTAEDLLARR